MHAARRWSADAAREGGAGWLGEQRAGGTGLSPIKAIIEQAVRESTVTPRRIYLYYGARRRHELYDLPDLWRLEDAYSGLELIPVTSDDPAFDGMQGNVGRVAARYTPHADCEAYVAGPPQMVRETIHVLSRAGLERERIHFDDALLADKAARYRHLNPGEPPASCHAGKNSATRRSPRSGGGTPGWSKPAVGGTIQDQSAGHRRSCRCSVSTCARKRSDSV